MDNDRQKDGDKASPDDSKRKKRKEKQQQQFGQDAQDAQSKSRMVSAATIPGAISTDTFGTVEPGQHAITTNTPSSTTHSIMSADAMAKNRARRTGGAVRGPGAYASDTTVDAVETSGDERIALQSIEDDLQVKNRARASRASGTTDVGAVRSAGGSQIPSKASGRSPKTSQAARDEARTLADEQAALLTVEEDLIAKNQARAARSLLDPAQRKASREAERFGRHDKSNNNRLDPSAPGMGVATGISVDNGFQQYQDEYSKEFGEEFDPDKQPPQESEVVETFRNIDGNQHYQPPPPREAPIHIPRDDSPHGNQDPEDQGIAAELAPLQLIDPLDMQAVPTAEEEAMEERKRFRKYLCLGALALLIISAAIVIPVVLIFGRPPPPVEPTLSPTAPPTNVPSAAPSSSRLAAILRFAATRSDPSVFLDVKSPQYLAATWVADEDEVQAPTGSIQLLQRYILAVFYYSTGGDDWEECSRAKPQFCYVGSSWLYGDTTECQWHGVRCTPEGVVQKILIGNQAPLGNNQVGTLPSELAELTNITSLVLIEGKIRGTIPTEYGRLSLLNSILIQDQLLTGTIPEEIFQNCKLLDMLALGGNALGGPIPSTIGTLPKLLDLQLFANNFTGTIPTEIGSLSTLKNIEFQINQLDGTIPETFYNLNNLTAMNLGKNGFTGRISSSIGRLTNLRIFEVYHNDLIGNLPLTLYTLPNLQIIDIEDNGFNGFLPEQLRALNGTLRQFVANDNEFVGSLPFALNLLTKLEILFLHGNFLTGSVPYTLCVANINITMPPTVNCNATRTCCTSLV